MAGSAGFGAAGLWFFVSNAAAFEGGVGVGTRGIGVVCMTWCHFPVMSGAGLGVT